MRASKTLVILFVVSVTSSCVTEKAQDIQDSMQATPANMNTITSNRQITQLDAQEVQNKEWLSYEPAVVELKGKLITKMYYGPPNYGENPKTDSKEEYPILILSKAVNVRGNPDPGSGYERISVKNIRKMQLVLTLPHKNMIGKNVIVKGTLFHAFTGHHRTDVLMNVQSISLAVSD